MEARLYETRIPFNYGSTSYAHGDAFDAEDARPRDVEALLGAGKIEFVGLARPAPKRAARKPATQEGD